MCTLNTKFFTGVSFLFFNITNLLWELSLLWTWHFSSSLVHMWAFPMTYLKEFKREIITVWFALDTEINSEVRCHGEEASDFGDGERREETTNLSQFFFSQLFYKMSPNYFWQGSRHWQFIDKRGLPLTIGRRFQKGVSRDSWFKPRLWHCPSVLKSSIYKCSEEVPWDWTHVSEGIRTVMWWQWRGTNGAEVSRRWTSGPLLCAPPGRGQESQRVGHFAASWVFLPSPLPGEAGRRPQAQHGSAACRASCPTWDPSVARERISQNREAFTQAGKSLTRTGGWKPQLGKSSQEVWPIFWQSVKGWYVTVGCIVGESPVPSTCKLILHFF